jgi:O-antigen ligase
VVGWTLVSFFNVNKEEVVNGIKNKSSWVLLAFFLWTLVSAFFSDDVSERGFTIEVKMTFLIFPFLLFCFHWPLAILRRCVIAFVSGCFFASLYLILRAFSYALGGDSDYFFYTMFSDFIHASYFSMYLFLALVFVLILYPRWFHEQKALIYSTWFFAAIFVTTIFLCASKLGLICLFLLLPILLMYRWRKKFPVQKSIVLLSMGFLTMALVLFLLPGTSSRLVRLSQLSYTNIDKTATESSAVRLLIWDQCLQLIREKPVLGTGVADVNTDLYHSYEVNGLTGALQHHLNAHNQYFQTLIGLGILGSIPLFLLTFGQIFHALVKRRILLFFFSVLITLNFLVESMLQSSAGVLFVAFFFCFLQLCDKDLLNADPIMNPVPNA